MVQRAGEGRTAFNLRRLSRTLRLLLGNRLSVVGLILLVIFSGAALSASFIYPENPQLQTAGAQRAMPEWVMLFPEGYYLSKNLVVVNDPFFSTPSSLQEWSYAVSPVSQLSYVSFSRSSTVPPGGQTASFQISSFGGNVTTRVAKTFHYPYHGPPGDFLVSGHLSARVDAVGPSLPVSLRFFIDRGNKSFTLWSINVTQSGAWQEPPYPIDGIIQEFATAIGSSAGGLSPMATIFPGAGDYTYGVEAIFHGPANVFIPNLSLVLQGTAFGLLGTDTAGSDLFAQDLYGARISLFVGLLAAFIGIFLGLLVGLLAGYKSGLTDEVLMRFTDMMLTVPALPLLLVLIGVLGPSLINIILIIGFLGWMGFARVIRSQILSLKERPFIEAARAAGAGTRHILTKHMFPNVVSLTYVNLALSVPAAILTEAALSFLGLGDPSSPSWGQILSRAQEDNALSVWWWVVPPGIAIALVSLSFVLIGYALDELFNPKLRKRR